MIYLELFFAFFKIGLFSFGGGYAMIPLISDVIIKNGWMVQSEFAQIIGIAEMTPGPIAVNSATFVGHKVAGMGGSVAATLGVAMPSLLLILFISKLFFKYSNHKITQHVFIGIRPVIGGLILSSAILLFKNAILQPHNLPDVHFNFETFIIFIIVLFIALKKKMHPILIICISAILGLLTLYI